MLGIQNTTNLGEGIGGRGPMSGHFDCGFVSSSIPSGNLNFRQLCLVPHRMCASSNLTHSSSSYVTVIVLPSFVPELIPVNE